MILFNCYLIICIYVLFVIDDEKPFGEVVNKHVCMNVCLSPVKVKFFSAYIRGKAITFSCPTVRISKWFHLTLEFLFIASTDIVSLSSVADEQCITHVSDPCIGIGVLA